MKWALICCFTVVTVVCAQGQFIDLASSTQVNGIDPVFGLYGQLDTTYQGQQGQYAFWKPEHGKMQILPYPTASISGINSHCIAGNYTDFANYTVAGFQQCTDKNGNVQFFEFALGAIATSLTAQLHGTQTTFGYSLDFHLKSTGFVATPVFDANGAVKSYNTTSYSVPGATSTRILTANETGMAGSFEAADGKWSGFIQPNGGALQVVNFPGSQNTAVTALGSKCYAGYSVASDGAQPAFLYCHSFIPISLGYGATWITDITKDGDVAGYFPQSNGGYRSFVWKKFAAH